MRLVSTGGFSLKRIEELISCYNNILRKEDPIIISKLNLINQLYDECENSEDLIFFNEIINNFADIVEYQKDMVSDLQSELDYNDFLEDGKDTSLFAPAQQIINNFTSEEEIQKAFSIHFTTVSKKTLSSYTVNDYCSRIKNLWKNFYNDYKNGNLPIELSVNEEFANPNTPLMNAYKHIDELNCYVGIMSATTNEKKNWANIAAALNKFIDFITETKK